MTSKSDTGVRYVINRIIQTANTSKTTLMVLSCVVVFITTYILILPAITLDQDEANKQGGIDVATEQQADVITEDSEATEEPVASEDAASADMLTFESKNYKVQAECGDADLPSDTEIVAEEIGKKDKDYDALFADTLDALRQDSKSNITGFAFAKFYDISLMSGGEPIEPNNPVNVTISYDKALKVSDADKLRIVHFAVDEESGDTIVEVLDSEQVSTEIKNDKMTAATFEAASFSVYAIVYTVDFEYDVDGKKYTYSIEGGSKINLAELLLQLQVIKDDPKTDSDEVQLFMADIDTVDFSSPNLVSVEQDEDGAWVLTSLRPFTSEETLTVNMQNGDVFTVKVTDAQPAATNMNDFDGVNKFVIWGVGSDGRNYALKADGTTAEIDPNAIDYLGEEYQWTIEYGWESGGDRYVIRPVADNRNSLALNQGYHPGSELVQSGRNGIHLYPPYTSHKNQQNDNYTDNNSGWILEGWGWTRLNLGNSSHQFEGNPDWCSDINITRQEQLSQYTFTVQTEEFRKGSVSGTNQDGETQYTSRSFNTITNTTSGTKTNLYSIQAHPVSSGRYLFDYWDLNGTPLNFGSEIGAGQLTIPYNESVLTAHFKNNPDYVVPDEEKEGHSIDKTALDDWLEKLKTRPVPFESGGCDKTAELYDYENRIYRVDLTAKSSLTSFVGDIDLGFMLDVSGSMKFPSKLDPVAGLESVDINHINDNSSNQGWLDHDTTYYLISDKGSTATVYEIRWGTWVFNSYGQTRTGWGYKDASKDDNSMRYILNNSAWSGGEVGLSYPIYTDGDPGKKRLDYLESSIDNTIKELNVILNALSVASDPANEPKVKVAWNTFAKPLMSTHHNFSSVVGLNVRPNYTTSGGTSIDLALLDAAGKKRSDDDGNTGHLVYEWNSGITYSDTSGFEWEDDAVKFAVLITDGAPQRNGIDIEKKLVTDAANLLKNGEDGIAGTDDDVKLLTVGLSMGDVKKGSVLLYDIADPDANNEPLFYKADTGDELQYALYEMLRQAMTDAIVQSDITDTVNEAFYPVDKVTGAPLTNNNVIDLNGVKIGNSVNDLTQEQKNAGYGTIHQSGETYTVTWENQDVYGKEDGGWHGTIYEKAKEDFLGGNAVRTNDPNHDAVVQAKSYKVNPEDTPIPLKESILSGNGRAELETPRVNVNELAIPKDSTKWTVYLGTKVEDLAEHLKEMYENIPVKQVITNGEDTDGDGFKDKVVGNKDSGYYYSLKESASDKREDEVAGTQQFFYLKDLIKKINGGNDIDWESLITLSDEEGDGNTGLVFPYDLYGQDNPGKITLKLEKDHDLGDHVTTETGEAVETYTLRVLFEPSYDHLPVGIGGDGSWPYHTGGFGLGDYGNAAGIEDRKYEHVIDVFAKKLQILKADQEQNTITGSEAVFTLYRKATAAEMSDDAIEKVSVAGLTGQYIVIETLTTNNGVVRTDALPLLENNEPYYLVETEAPDGYNRLTEPLQVKIDMDGHNTWTKKTDGSTSQTKPNPYVVSDWLQEATIKVTDSSGNETSSAVFVLPQGEYERYNSTNDTTDASVTYKIINESGVTLPEAGGPGTTWIYLIGSLLLLGCGIALVTRRRMRI